MKLHLLYLAVLLFLVPLVSAENNGVSWFNITKYALSQLDPSQFTTISAPQLASIPVAAISGLTTAQLQATNVTAGAGFTVTQIGALSGGFSSSQCSSLPSNLMQNILPSSFPGFSKGCLGDFSTTQLGALNAAQVSYFTPTACAGFTSSNINGIVPAAFSGFNSTHISYFVGGYSSSCCSGITSTQAAALDGFAFAGFTKACTSYLAGNAFSTISAAQLSNITVAGASGFSNGLIGGLSDASGPGWTVATLGAVPGGYASSGCAGFTAGTVGNMLPPTFAGWNKQCTLYLSDSAFSQVTASQISYLTPAGASGLVPGTISNMPDAAGAGWTSTSLAAVSNGYASSGCSGFAPGHVAAMSGFAFSGWQKNCLLYVPNNAFSLVSAEQISNLTVNAIGGIGQGLMQALNYPAGAGWNASQVSAFSNGYSTSGCAGVSSSMVAYMTTAAFAGWISQCLVYLPASAFSQTTPAQINAILPAATKGMTQGLVSNMPGTAAAGWNAQNLATFSNGYSTSGCAGFTPDQIGNITVAAFSGFTSQCVVYMPGNAFTKVSAAQIAQFTSGAGGMTNTLMANMPPAAAAGWTASGLGNISSGYSSSGCAGFTPDQFAQIQIAVYSGWSASCINDMTPKIFATITSNQINSIPSTAFPGINGLQTPMIPDAVLTAIPLTLLQYMSGYGVNGLTPHQFTILIQQYKIQFINLWSYRQLGGYAAVSLDNLLLIKNTTLPQISYLATTIPGPYNSTTWLQLLFTSPAAIDAAILQQFPFTTVMGITATAASLMSTAAIQVMTGANYSYYIPNIVPDTMSGFNCSQLALFYNKKVVGAMYTATYQVFEKNYAACPGSGSATSTGPAPTGFNSGITNTNGWTAGITGGTFTNTNTNTVSSSSTSTGKHNSLGGGALAGIIIGALAVVGAVSAIVYVFLIRRHAADRTPLLKA